MLKFELNNALRSLSLRPLQAVLSLVGVLIGVAAFVAMLAIGEGAKRQAIEEVERVGARNVVIQNVRGAEEGQQGFDRADVRRIENGLPMADGVVPVKGGAVPYGKHHLPLITTTANAQEILNLKLARGRFLTSTDVEQKRAVCVLGAELAGKLGANAHLGSDLLLGATPFHVVGILDKESTTTLVGEADKSVWIPLGVGMDESLSGIVVHLKKGADFAVAKTQIERLLKSAGVRRDFQVVIPAELIRQQMTMERTFNRVLMAVAALSLLVGGIGVANIMLATVSTRTKEIGVRRALGATRRHILRQFLAEALILTVVGAAAGLLLGGGVGILLDHFDQWQTTVTLWPCVVAFSLALAVGLLSGLYPAIKASKLSPVVALRS